MAIMIPDKPFETNSLGEKKVFKALQNGLPNTYYVFHSLRWIGKNKPQGEADFVVFAPNKGILVIEVKGGIIECRNRLFYQTNRSTEEEKEIRDPEHQASDSKFALLNLLKEKKVYDCLVCHAVWFPSHEYTNRRSLPANYDLNMLLDESDLSNPTEGINRAFGYWSSQYGKSTNLSPNKAKKVLNILAPTFSILPSMRADYNKREREFIRLTNEQIRILDFLDEQQFATISGGAGTGKTLIALEKARRLIENKESVLFLCYNSGLAQFLKSKHTKKYLTIATFHSLASEYIPSKAYQQEGYDKLAELFIDYLLTEDSTWAYTHIIIDEGQDFEEDWFIALKERTKGKFYVFYDKNQNIYRNNTSDFLLHADCKLTLTKNCRNTIPIAKTAIRNLRDKKATSTAFVEGKKAIWIESDDDNKKLKYVNQIIKKFIEDGGGRPEDISILTYKSTSNSILSGRTKILTYQLSSFPKENQVCFTTVRKFKGLEAKLLILIDVEIGRYQENNWSNLMYIGCSRARHELHIISNSSNEQAYKTALNYLMPKDSKRIKSKRLFIKQLNLEPKKL